MTTPRENTLKAIRFERPDYIPMLNPDHFRRVDVINLQDLVNGIDWIAERFACRICIDPDINRQAITAQGTPQQIDDLIRQEVSRLARKEGGLMTIYGLYPGVPMQNAAALMDAMEKYATYYA